MKRTLSFYPQQILVISPSAKDCLMQRFALLFWIQDLWLPKQTKKNYFTVLFSMKNRL